MKKTLLAAVMGATLSMSAFAANDMYIDVKDSSYDLGTVVLPNPPGGTIDIGTGDANTTTGIFNEFGFSQLLATSIYDFSDGSVFGSFYDTNIASELAAANVPASGTALDGTSTVTLVTPDCAGGQCDIDALSPLVPPLGSDSEGFLGTWDLQVEYHFEGTLTAGGPVYTGGTFTVYFNDKVNDANDRVVLIGNLTGSTLEVANLLLNFELTYAEAGFLYVDNGSGSFVEAGAGTKLVLDTNVNPPIPTPDQLLLVADDTGNPNAIRQSTLDGSITAYVPEPGSLALLGIGALGMSMVRRRRAA